MYDCQQCGMPLDDFEKQCWICSHFTDFDDELIYFYIEDENAKKDNQTKLDFPE